MHGGRNRVSDCRLNCQDSIGILICRQGKFSEDITDGKLFKSKESTIRI